VTRLLLDTHVWVWSHLTPAKLSRRVTSELNDPANERWLSPASIWELALLVEKGRVVLDQDIDKWLALATERSPVKEALLTFSVAVEMAKVKLVHRDPVDRLLVATARVFELTLVTGDQRLIHSRQVPVLENR
jgi:PIN domain nuclease of toxin-antitoxin system